MTWYIISFDQKHVPLHGHTIVLMHSCTESLLGCFSINIHDYVIQKFVISIFCTYDSPNKSDKYLRVQLLNHMIGLYLVLLRNWQIVFQSGCTILHFHQQRMRVPVTPHPHKHLVLPLFCFFSHSDSCTAVSHWFNKRYLSAGDKGDVLSITGLGRSPGRGNGHPLLYSCMENPMDRGAWRPCRPWGHKELDMT